MLDNTLIPFFPRDSLCLRHIMNPTNRRCAHPRTQPTMTLLFCRHLDPGLALKQRFAAQQQTFISVPRRTPTTTANDFADYWLSRGLRVAKVLVYRVFLYISSNGNNLQLTIRMTTSRNIQKTRSSTRWDPGPESGKYSGTNAPSMIAIWWRIGAMVLTCF